MEFNKKRSLQSFFGAIRIQAKVSIDQLGRMLCLLNFGGYLGLKEICDLISYGTSIIKSKFPLLFSGKVALRSGNLCLKIDRRLNNSCGGNPRVVPEVVVEHIRNNLSIAKLKWGGRQALVD
ncbi:hypothetical protein H5410_016707 [Solanum commersonii]|uniref:Uncharacterized protein n=1 Tax=Solanum commersonii TaxID=4109 RepID=A0A9J5ZXS9_SOLCO|nr:hypothetical protein H5410_016707 [Solanum commersonii]